MKINVKKKKKKDPFADPFQVLLPEENTKEETDEPNKKESTSEVIETGANAQDASEEKVSAQTLHNKTPNGVELSTHATSGRETAT